jgi:16S rRNA processing protein RimM
LTLVTAGRVGRAHGFDGSFWVDGASHPLSPGTVVVLGEQQRAVERRAGTDSRPLIRLADMPNPREHRGEPLLVDQELDEGEWLVADLEGCEVPGLGKVKRVIDAPSCGVLELDDGTLVPLVTAAIASVDLGAKTIEVHRRFLGLEEEGG